MGCGGCGKRPKRNNVVDSRGNKIKKYAYLHPHQRDLIEKQKNLQDKDKDKGN